MYSLSFRENIDRYGLNLNNALFCITAVERDNGINRVVSDCMLWRTAVNEDENCGVKGPYWRRVGGIEFPIILRLLSYGATIVVGFDDNFCIEDEELLEAVIRVRKNTPRGKPHIGVSDLPHIPYEDRF